MTGIIVALVFWAVVTLLTPAKVRPLISAVLLIAVAVYVTNVLKTLEQSVHVPASETQEAYDLSLEDFARLSKGSVEKDLLLLPEAELLYNKGLITHEDLSAEQLQSIKSHSQYNNIATGKSGLLIRRLPAHVEMGEVIPEAFGASVVELPYVDVNLELQLEKQVIRKIEQAIAPMDKNHL